MDFGFSVEVEQPADCKLKSVVIAEKNFGTQAKANSVVTQKSEGASIVRMNLTEAIGTNGAEPIEIRLESHFEFAAK